MIRFSLPHESSIEERVLIEKQLSKAVKALVTEGNPPKYVLVHSLSSNEVSELKKLLSEKLVSKIPDKALRCREYLFEYFRRCGVNERVADLASSYVAGLGPIEYMLLDDDIEDIQCFCANTPVFVTHRVLGKLETNIVFSAKELNTLVRRMARLCGVEISTLNPKVDGCLLPTGDRVSMVLGGEVSRSSNFTIRKFPRIPWNPLALVENETLTPELLSLLWIAVEERIPIMIFGRSGTGKTSLANALAMTIPLDAYVAVVCDVPEMRLYHKNVLYLYASHSKSKVSMEELIAHALRRGVDYIVVNEVRLSEARAFMHAVASGHGGVTTIHASCPRAVFARLRDLGVERSVAEELKILIEMRIVSERPRRRVVYKVYYVQEVGSGFEPKFRTLYYLGDIDREVAEALLTYIAEVCGKAVDELRDEAVRRAEMIRANYLECSSPECWYSLLRARWGVENVGHSTACPHSVDVDTVLYGT